MEFYENVFKRVCNSTMKWLLFSIHLFSSTPLYIAYVLLLLVSLFHNERDNYLVMLCSLVANFLFISSFILVFVLYSKPALASVKMMVGSSFMDKYFPPSPKGFRGLSPLLVFVLTFLAILLVDYVTLQSSLDLHTIHVHEMQQRALHLSEKVGHLAANKNSTDIRDQLVHTLEIRGFFGNLVNHPTITFFTDFFSCKK